MKAVLNFVFLFFFACTSFASYPEYPAVFVSPGIIKVEAPLVFRSGEEVLLHIDGRIYLARRIKAPNYEGGYFADPIDITNQYQGQSHHKHTGKSGPQAGPSTRRHSAPQSGSIGGSLQKGLTHATEAAFGAGFATAVYRGLLQTPEDLQRVAEIRKQIEANNQIINHNNIEIRNLETKLFSHFQQNQLLEGLQTQLRGSLNVELRLPDDYILKTKHPLHRLLLEENRDLLRSLPVAGIKRKEGRRLGLEVNQMADEAFSQNQVDAGYELLSIARGFADLAVGWDPVTGIIRNVYESAVGRNLITGELLNTTAHAAAVIGVLTFGLASGYGRGLSILKKLHLDGKVSQFIQNTVQKILKIDPTQSFKNSFQAAPKLFSELLSQDPTKISHYSRLINKTKDIHILAYTADGQNLVVKQELSQLALDGYEALSKSDGLVYRMGQFTKDGRRVTKINAAGESPQYWAFDFSFINDPNYIKKSSAYFDKVDFIEVGQLNKNSPYIVRTVAPRLVNGKKVNDTGSDLLEVVTSQNQVKTIQFYDLTGVIQ